MIRMEAKKYQDLETQESWYVVTYIISIVYQIVPKARSLETQEESILKSESVMARKKNDQTKNSQCPCKREASILLFYSGLQWVNEAHPH